MLTNKQKLTTLVGIGAKFVLASIVLFTQPWRTRQATRLMNVVRQLCAQTFHSVQLGGLQSSMVGTLFWGWFPPPPSPFWDYQTGHGCFALSFVLLSDFSLKNVLVCCHSQTSLQQTSGREWQHAELYTQQQGKWNNCCAKLCDSEKSARRERGLFAILGQLTYRWQPSYTPQLSWSDPERDR